MALVVAALAGLRQRHRRRRLPRPPADHDPGHELRRARPLQRLAAPDASRRARASRPSLRTLGRRPFAGVVPYSLLVFVPVDAADPARACGGPATAGCCTRSATTRSPARLSGARAWQVLVVLYVISALLAGDRRPAPCRASPTPPASRSSTRRCCRRSRRRSSAGRRSSAAGAATAGTIVGALILTVLTALLTALGLPEPTRQIVFGVDHRARRGRLHAGHRRDLTERERRPTCRAATSASTSAARTSSGWSSSTTPATGAVLDRGPGRDARGRRPGRASWRGSPTVGAEAIGALARASRRSGSACPGSYDPATGATRFLVNCRAPWAGRPVAGPVGGGARAARPP